MFQSRSCKPIDVKGSTKVPATIRANICGAGGTTDKRAANWSRTQGNYTESDW